MDELAEVKKELTRLTEKWKKEAVEYDEASGREHVNSAGYLQGIADGKMQCALELEGARSGRSSARIVEQVQETRIDY